jgi:Na+-transporting NADH:ubiquinone oxidoreductase subunit B
MARVDAGPHCQPMTVSAPHVRDVMSVQTAMSLLVVSLIPPMLVAVYNTGYQANVAMERLGVTAAPGWRGQLIDLLGSGYDASAPWAAVVHGGVYFIPVFLAVILAGAGWCWLFARARGRQAGPGLLGIALVVALMLPPTIPLWLAALGMSFGIVVGREIFGGFGRNVVSPAVAALAFLHIAYPADMMAGRVWVPVQGYREGTPLELAQEGGLTALEDAGVSWMDAFVGIIPGAFGDTSALAAALGAAVLVWTRLASWRVLAGILVGAVATAILIGGAGDGGASVLALPWSWHLAVGSLAFGAVYIATDPVTAATTNAGRWLYGLLIGTMAIVIRVAAPAHADGVVFAILLGNIFAPAIDYLVMWANIRSRRRHHVR